MSIQPQPAPISDSFVEEYRTQYGEAIFALACYSSVAVILTADLVQTIRVNTEVKASWEDVVQFLLTRLVRDLGDGMFEVRADYRQRFVQELETREYEPEASKVVAQVLVEYYQGIIEQGSSHPGYSVARIQTIAAYAFLDADFAYQELREEFLKLAEQDNPVERVRLATLVETLEPQFADRYEELVYYARSWRYEVQQNTEALRAAMSPLVSRNLAPPSDAVPMPVPKQMFHSLRKEQIAEDPLAEAERRIEQVRAAAGTVLDLSGIGLHKIPEKVFEMWYLQQLDLSNNPLRWLPWQLEKMDKLETIRANHCELWGLDPKVFDAPNLKTLELNHNKLFNLPTREHWKPIHVVLKGNRFQSFPYAILQSPLNLYIDGNPLDQKVWAETPVSDLPSEAEGADFQMYQQETQQAFDIEAPLENLDQEESARQIVMSGALDKERCLQWQRTVAKGSSRLLKALFWMPYRVDLDDLLPWRKEIFQSWRPFRSRIKGPVVFEWQSSIMEGIQLGMAPDMRLQLLEIAQEDEDAAIEAFCSGITVLNIFMDGDDLDSLAHLEAQLNRVHQLPQLRIAVLRGKLKHPDLEDQLETILDRYKKLTNVDDFDLSKPVDLQRLLAYHFHENEESAYLEIEDIGGYAELFKRMATSDPLDRRDFSLVNRAFSQSGFGGDEPSLDLDRMMALGEITEVPGSYRSVDYLSSFHLLIDYYELRDRLEARWSVPKGSFNKFISEGFGKPEAGEILDGKFHKLGWVRDSKLDEDYILFPHEIPSADPHKPSISDKAYSVMELHFEYLPEDLFRELILTIVPPDQREVRNVGQHYIHMKVGEAEVFWAYHPEEHRLELTTSNGRAKADSDQFMTDLGLKQVQDLMKGKWATLKYETWIHSNQNPTRYHVGTVKRLQQDQLLPHTTLYTPYSRYFTSLFGMELEEPRDHSRDLKKGSTYLFTSVEDYNVGQRLRSELMPHVNEVCWVFPDISPEEPPRSNIEEFVDKAEYLISVLSRQALRTPRFMLLVLELLQFHSKKAEQMVFLVEGMQDQNWLAWCAEQKSYWESLVKRRGGRRRRRRKHTQHPTNSFHIVSELAQDILDHWKHLEQAPDRGFYIRDYSDYQSYGVPWVLETVMEEAPQIQTQGTWQGIFATGRIAKMEHLKGLSRHLNSLELRSGRLTREALEDYLTLNTRLPVAPNTFTVLLVHNDEERLYELEEGFGEMQSAFEVIVLHEANKNMGLQVLGQSPAKYLPFPNSEEDWEKLAWAIVESGERIAEQVVNAPANVHWESPNEYQNYALRDLYRVYRRSSWYRKREEEVQKYLEENLDVQRNESRPEGNFRAKFYPIVFESIKGPGLSDPEVQSHFIERLKFRRLLLGMVYFAGSWDQARRLLGLWLTEYPDPSSPQAFFDANVQAALGFPPGDIQLDKAQLLPEERAYLRWLGQQRDQ